MIVFLNGEFVPEEKAVVSVFDRSFQLGDGLYEALRVYGGRPFRWAEHWERFRRGAEYLKIRIPFDEKELIEGARQLIERNRMPEAMMRITLSRGVGQRGHSPKGAVHPTLVMTLHPAPDDAGKAPPEWRVITASPRLPTDEPLSLFKTANKLPQILARMEADAAGADEALLLNTAGEIVEGGASNLFWIDEGVVCTPPLASGILAGVTRIVVFEICRKAGFPIRETRITPAQLHGMQGVFVSLSSRGVVELVALDGQNLQRSPITQKIRTAYEEMVAGLR
jgi:branched-subunit amino acid aminotransferase/4-amino-4-deoxychorismate lyase